MPTRGDYYMVVERKRVFLTWTLPAIAASGLLLLQGGPVAASLAWVLLGWFVVSLLIICLPVVGCSLGRSAEIRGRYLVENRWRPLLLEAAELTVSASTRIADQDLLSGDNDASGVYLPPYVIDDDNRCSESDTTVSKVNQDSNPLGCAWLSCDQSKLVQDTQAAYHALCG